ncbi:MAG: amino acid--tRNA ligase-related protein [Spirochaeta sp.]
MHTAPIQMQAIRSRLYTVIRSFFAARDFREVETPCLAPAVIPESAVPAFATQYNSYHGDIPLFALPSPEYYMKQLLAQGSGSIFQISRCFRNAEVLTNQHNIEFTMLEWYTVRQDYLYNLGMQQDVLNALLLDNTLWQLIADLGRTPAQLEVLRSRLGKPIRKISLQTAFEEWADISLSEGMQRGYIDPDRPHEAMDDAFHRILVDSVEPNIPRDTPVALYDYPACVPTTGRRKPGTPWTERWELYIGGMEIANCYTEADAHELEGYYHQETATLRKNGRPETPDTGFLQRISAMPQCSGNALGIDRLLMQLTGETRIQGVILFPCHDSIQA